MIPHEEAQALISARLDAPLDPTENRALLTHLATCAECRQFAEQTNLLARGLRDLPHLAPSPVVSRAVLERISEGRSPWPRVFDGMRFNPVPALAAAAIIVLLIVGIAVLRGIGEFGGDDEPGGNLAQLDAGTQTARATESAESAAADNRDSALPTTAPTRPSDDPPTAETGADSNAINATGARRPTEDAAGGEASDPAGQADQPETTDEPDDAPTATGSDAPSGDPVETTEANTSQGDVDGEASTEPDTDSTNDPAATEPGIPDETDAGVAAAESGSDTSARQAPDAASDEPTDPVDADEGTGAGIDTEDGGSTATSEPDNDATDDADQNSGIFAASAPEDGTPTVRPTAIVISVSPPTATSTPEPTETATPDPTETPVRTSTPEPTETATPEPTESPSPTTTPNPTETATPEPTETPEPTSTPEPTETPEPTSTPEPTITPEPTETPIPTETATPEPTATETPTPTQTATLEPTATETPTEPPTPEPTQTPEPEQGSETGQSPQIVPRDGNEVVTDDTGPAADQVIGGPGQDDGDTPPTPEPTAEDGTEDAVDGTEDAVDPDPTEEPGSSGIDPAEGGDPGTSTDGDATETPDDAANATIAGGDETSGGRIVPVEGGDEAIGAEDNGAASTDDVGRDDQPDADDGDDAIGDTDTDATGEDAGASDDADALNPDDDGGPIDLGDAQVLIGSIPGPRTPDGSLRYANGGFIYGIDGGDLSIVGSDGSVVSLGQGFYPTWSPSGGSVAFTVDNGESALVYQSAGGGAFPVSNPLPDDGSAVRDVAAGWSGDTPVILRTDRDRLSYAELSIAGGEPFWRRDGISVTALIPIQTDAGWLIGTSEGWLLVDGGGGEANLGAVDGGEVTAASVGGGVVAYLAGGTAWVGSVGSISGAVPLAAGGGIAVAPDGSAVAVTDGVSLAIYGLGGGAPIASWTAGDGSAIGAPAWLGEGIVVPVGSTLRLLPAEEIYRS